jgi:hypothetical protein
VPHQSLIHRSIFCPTSCWCTSCSSWGRGGFLPAFTRCAAGVCQPRFSLSDQMHDCMADGLHVPVRACSRCTPPTLSVALAHVAPHPLSRLRLLALHPTHSLGCACSRCTPPTLSVALAHVAPHPLSRLRLLTLHPTHSLGCALHTRAFLRLAFFFLIYNDRDDLANGLPI